MKFSRIDGSIFYCARGAVLLDKTFVDDTSVGVRFIVYQTARAVEKLAAVKDSFYIDIQSSVNKNHKSILKKG